MAKSKERSKASVGAQFSEENSRLFSNQFCLLQTQRKSAIILLEQEFRILTDKDFTEQLTTCCTKFQTFSEAKFSFCILFTVIQDFYYLFFKFSDSITVSSLSPFNTLNFGANGVLRIKI